MRFFHLSVLFTPCWLWYLKQNYIFSLSLCSLCMFYVKLYMYFFNEPECEVCYCYCCMLTSKMSCVKFIKMKINSLPSSKKKKKNKLNEPFKLQNFLLDLCADRKQTNWSIILLWKHRKFILCMSLKRLKQICHWLLLFWIILPGSYVNQ